MWEDDETCALGKGSKEKFQGREEEEVTVLDIFKSLAQSNILQKKINIKQTYVTIFLWK